jgi:hypothetical protein
MVRKHKNIAAIASAVLLSLTLAACTDDDDIPDANTIEGVGDITVNPESEHIFLWKRAEDEITYSRFLLNFGVGYSYDAVGGSYCDWQDIRCQVLNRHFIEDLESRTGEHLLNFNNTTTTTVRQKYSYSLRDYVARINMETEEEVNLGLYNKEKRRRQYFIEDGVQERFYYQLQETHTVAQRYISYASLLDLYYKEKDIFTESFRNSIDHLSETTDDNIAAVDSFVNVWGTHVIVSADLGASLSIDLMNDMWRYRDQASESEITMEQFLDAVAKNGAHSSTDDYVWLENSRLNIDAKGGDQSTLTNLIGEHAADGTRTFSIDGISKWRTSIVYNPDNEYASNVELVGMAVIPIWEFAKVIDKWTALRIQAAITQDAALQQQLMGDWNFFDASFPIRYTTAKCQHHKNSSWSTYTRTDSNSDPMIVNIESGGRYIATVCHEWIDGKEMWVCYPIYEGKVNLACGVGIDNSQNAYKVRWLNGKATVTATGETAAGTFYITSGGIGVKPADGTTYAASTAYPYIELAGGVQPDGSYSATAYPVKKDGGTFYIDTTATINNLINFDRAADRYTRNPNYTYIFNPNELKQ